MPVYKKERVYSETGTSIDQGIPVMQKGVISYVPLSGTTIGIPCQIPNPTMLRLMPMTDLTADTLGASHVMGRWYSDLTLNKASDVYTCFASIASAVSNSLYEVGRRLRMSSTYKLYVANAAMNATYAASNTLLASKSYWSQLEDYGTNQKLFLKVVTHATASGNFKAKRQMLAYEITGYEY